MASLQVSDYAALFKELYTSNRIYNMVYPRNPFLGMVPKFESFEGDALPVPVEYAPTGGRSATIATANTNKLAASRVAFSLTRQQDYSLFDIDVETIMASRSDRGAFARALARESRMALRAIERSLATALFGSGSGSLGQIGTVATTLITLAEIEDVVNFEVGMEVVLSTADGGGSLRDSGNSATITAIDRDAGTLTTDSNWGTQISGAAANDYIFVEGDYDEKLTGLLGWLPTTAPTSGDSHFGVDRSTDPVRLGGVRYDGSGVAIDEALQGALRRVGREGGAPDYCFINHNRYGELETVLGDKKRYGRASASGGSGRVADVGYQSMILSGPGGDVQVIADHNCPDGYAFLLQMDTWKLYSLGSAPFLMQEDGLEFLRNSASDSLEGRFQYYAQLGCNAPGYNAVVTLPANI